MRRAAKRKTLSITEERRLTRFRSPARIQLSSSRGEACAPRRQAKNAVNCTKSGLAQHVFRSPARIQLSGSWKTQCAAPSEKTLCRYREVFLSGWAGTYSPRCASGRRTPTRATVTHHRALSICTACIASPGHTCRSSRRTFPQARSKMLFAATTAMRPASVPGPDVGRTSAPAGRDIGRQINQSAFRVPRYETRGLIRCRAHGRRISTRPVPGRDARKLDIRLKAGSGPIRKGGFVVRNVDEQPLIRIIAGVPLGHRSVEFNSAPLSAPQGRACHRAPRQSLRGASQKSAPRPRPR